MGVIRNLFDKNKKEERSIYDRGSFSITSFFGDGGTVSEEQALEIPAVTSSVELITSSIATLPIFLYKKNDDNEVIKIPDKRVRLLNDEPNTLLNGYNFKKQIVKNYLFYGTSYTKVERVRNDVTALYNLPVDKTSVIKYMKNAYRTDAKISVENFYGERKYRDEFFPEELIIVLKDSEDGLSSKGVLKNNPDILQLALDELSYTKNVLSNGALPIGVLRTASKLSKNALDRLRESWSSIYSGSSNSGKTVILEDGLDYRSLSLNPNDLELVNSKKNTISEIARIFNVPESMINESLNKYNNNEQNNIHFLQYCVAPIITSIEAAINKSLLLESEKNQGYYFKFDTSQILRTTEKEKVETAVLGMRSGLYSINEARSKVDMKAIETDYYLWGLGNIFLNPKTGKMVIPNLGTTIDPENVQNELTDEQKEELAKVQKQQE